MARRKVALVTGGATGIGRAAVLHLARAGFDVALNFRSSADAARVVAAEAEEAGAKVLMLPADVADDAAVREMLARVDQTFGLLDALINNAGTTISTPPKDLEAVSVEDWDRVFAVNVRGLFLVTRASVRAAWCRPDFCALLQASAQPASKQLRCIAWGKNRLQWNFRVVFWRIPRP